MADDKDTRHKTQDTNEAAKADCSRQHSSPTKASHPSRLDVSIGAAHETNAQTIKQAANLTGWPEARAFACHRNALARSIMVGQDVGKSGLVGLSVGPATSVVGRLT